MGRANLLQNNFTGGEVSPRFYMRVENARYKAGVKRMQNLKIAPQGGTLSREGTAFVAEAKYRDSDVRLVNFEFNTQQAYILEFGDSYVRFYANNDIITESDITITGITNANPGVVTFSGGSVSNDQEFFINDVVGMTGLNGRRFVAAGVSGSTFQLHDIDGNPVNTTTFGTYTSGGRLNRIYEVATSYTESMLWDIDFVQSADVLFIVHPSVKPTQLSRTGNTAWTFTDIAFVNGPFLDQNTTTTTLTTSGTGDTSITITASATTGINKGTGFVSSDVGRQIRWWDGTNWFWYVITGFTNSTHVTASIGNPDDQGTPAGTTATKQWQLGSFSTFTGFPECCCFFQQRLFFGATDNQPDTFWGSAIDDFTNFGPGTTDSDSVSYTLASQKVNRIRWMESLDVLRIGTSGSEFTVTGSDTNSTISPSNIQVSRISSYGSSQVKPVSVGNATLFWQRTNRKLREMAYDYQSNGLICTDISIVSAHISEGGIRQVAYQGEPDGIVWTVRNDGVLIGLTYLRSENILGWHRHLIGGPSGTKVRSIACTPIDDQDQVWVAVQRIIGSEKRTYIERINNNFFDVSTNTIKDAVFLDSSLSFDGEVRSANLTPGATTGYGVTFTASAGVFTSADVGKHIRTTYTDLDGVMTESKGIISAYTNSTHVVVDIARPFLSTGVITSGTWTLSTDTLQGAFHLIGQTIDLLADGGTHVPVIVQADGSIPLSGQFTKVHIGYGYIQEIETLNLEGSSVLGSVQGSLGRITEVIVRFYQSVGLKLGFSRTELNGLEDIPFRTPNDQMDEGVPLFEGDKDVRPPNNYDKKLALIIRQEQCLPMNILGFVAKVESSDSQ